MRDNARQWTAPSTFGLLFTLFYLTGPVLATLECSEPWWLCFSIRQSSPLLWLQVSPRRLSLQHLFFFASKSPTILWGVHDILTTFLYDWNVTVEQDTSSMLMPKYSACEIFSKSNHVQHLEYQINTIRFNQHDIYFNMVYIGYCRYGYFCQ
jgi:hypothetical protein